jgi:crossover junction endodeoxyribonuclease RuvC
MLALGIDPGTATTGYAVVRQVGSSLQAVCYGVITTPAGKAMHLRLQTLFQELQAIIRTYQPTLCAVEELFFQKNVKTAISVAQARGVILLALAECGLQPGEYTPMQVKQAVVGYGNATKAQVQHMTQLLLALESPAKPDDAADALAVAICHLHNQTAYSLAQL